MGLASWALAVFVVGLGGSAQAQVRDRSVHWRTVTTEHFQLHYHTPLGVLARRTAAILEQVHARLVPIMEHETSGRVHVVLTDGTDSANGSATALPFPTMRLFATAPEDLAALDDHDDWMLGLVTHEHTHILHLDNISGLPAVINAIFGRVYAPNQVQPRWFIEGYATHMESAQTAGGRLRSSIFEMFMRMATLEDRLLRIDQLSNGIDDWPQGNSFYLYGSRFVDYIAREHGEQSLARIAEDYGGDLIPYGLNRTARRATGRGFTELYDDWQDSLRERYGADRERIVAAGVVEGRRITHHGQVARTPRYLDEDTVAYYANDGQSNGELRAIDARTGRDPRTVVRSAAVAYFSPHPDGRRLFFQSSDNVRDIYFLNDLFSLDRQTGEVTRLTNGRRAKQPDISPDGRRVVFTSNSSGTTHLMVADTSDVDGSAEVLLRNPRYEQVYTPRYSPDGRHVAFSHWGRHGHRDIRLLDVATGEVTRVTHDRALDSGPCFSPDGQTLYFSSDRTGVPNIYAYDVDAGELAQVTNVVSGAFHPAISPNGRRMVYLGYTSYGYDLFEMELDPSAFRAATPYVDDRPASDPGEATVTALSERYQAWPTLLPRSYLIEFYDDGFGQALGLTFAQSDVVGLHSYEGRIGISLTEGYVNPEVTWRWARSSIPVTMRLFRTVSPRGGLVVGGVPQRWVEDAVGGSVGISRSFARSFHSESVSLSYSIRNLRKGAPFGGDLDPNTPPPIVPTIGRFANLRAGWGYSDVRRHTFDMTPSHGRSLGVSVSLADPALGSEFRTVSASWTINRYLENPWVQHQVLAMRYSGGLSGGDLGRRGVFSIGGFPDSTFLDAFLDDVVIGGQALRGYPAFDRSGTQFHLLQLEYRIPLFRPQLGVQTLPAYVRRLYMNVFTDFGDAFFGELELEDFRWGVGTELFLDFTLGYYLSFTWRLGFAYGVGDGGGPQVYSHIGVPF